jgi:hypothetical protein
MKKSRLRPAGDVLLDIEPYLIELTDTHDLQHGEIMNLVYGWLMIHRPSNREAYTDGTFPEFRYGPREEEE